MDVKKYPSRFYFKKTMNKKIMNRSSPPIRVVQISRFYIEAQTNFADVSISQGPQIQKLAKKGKSNKVCGCVGLLSTSIVVKMFKAQNEIMIVCKKAPTGIRSDRW